MNALAKLSFPVALVLSLFMNATLFWTLWSLTNVDFDIDTVEATRIDFTRMRQDTEVQSRREEKVERERPQMQPEMPQMQMTSGGLDNTVARLAPMIDTGSALSGMKLTAGSDRDVIPLVRINPDYPPRALSRGIEGWVQVQFTITETGTVKDAIVVDSSPKGMFDEAAIKAILRWRYNPRVEEGRALERVGVQTVIRFELED
jgi:protein TonB